MRRFPIRLAALALSLASLWAAPRAAADIPQAAALPPPRPFVGFFLSGPAPSPASPTARPPGLPPSASHAPANPSGFGQSGFGQPGPSQLGPSQPGQSQSALGQSALAGTPGAQCLQAVRAAGRAAGLPEFLMAAIARVESGRADGHGGVTPWPWSINAEGVDYVYETKAAAIAGALAMRASGIRSMDIGCMQVNLMHHPDAFASLDEAFDPQANARYAARFLTDLYAKTGSWQQATAWYHSANPELGLPYERKVEAALAQERGRGGTEPVMSAAGYGGAIPINPTTGPMMLGNNAPAAHIIAAPAGTIGRGLDAYRSVPIAITGARIMRMPG